MERSRKKGKRRLSLLLALVLLIYGQAFPALAKTAFKADGEAQGEPQNPVYDADTDATEWSYVYFGSYPQTEVTDGPLKSALSKAHYNAEGDTSVGGKKYRRVGAGGGYRYFQWERIKWRVLQNDGSTLFVAADRGLDCQRYHEEYTSVTWEGCTLRSWLNEEFYAAAFRAEEQKAIVRQAAADEGENETLDDVRLLSVGEVRNSAYGFRGNSENSVSRQMKASDYAAAGGARIDGEKRTWWWLCSPGYDSDFAAHVSNHGDGMRNSVSVDTAYHAVVPALHINLSSDLWSMTEEEGAAGALIPENPSYDAFYDETEWSYVYFGSYPQAEVSGEALTSSIQNASYAGDDAVVDGVKYRRVRQSDGYHYFKWESVKWRVLQKEGGSLLVMADLGLDAREYHETAEDVSWEDSALYEWLNGEFYDAAFDEDEQGAVLGQAEGGSQADGLQGRVSLLSAEDVLNVSYGFCPAGADAAGAPSATRSLRASDYARAKGAELYDARGSCRWWLRSKGEGLGSAAAVKEDGSVDMSGSAVNAGGNAVVAALRLDLSSNFWSMAEDGGLSSDSPSYDEETDTSAWRIVTFGSYPQTEVSGEELTDAVTGASYDERGDAVADGVKYRRISIGDTSDSSNFGSAQTYRYFKWEPIKWRVLEEDGTELCLMADLGLDCRAYHPDGGSVAWTGSGLRSWLNDEFYQSAFRAKERRAILQEGSKENVRLLSAEEAVSAAHGFCGDGGKASGSRKVRPSDYAYVMGAYSLSADGADCWWWLSSSSASGDAPRAYNDGSIDAAPVTLASGAVVPVVRMDKALFLEPEDVPSNPKYNEIIDTTEWSYVYFGSYPQAEVSGEALTEDITEAFYDESGDALVDGVRYRRMEAGSSEDGEAERAYRYFKWERIKWRVLQKTEDALFVLADRGLDSRAYHDASTSVTWEGSALREWLNESFLNSAFGKKERRAIKEQTVENAGNSSYGISSGKDTKDLVYLLSEGEAKNASYGFCEDYSKNSGSRQMKASDYASALGASASNEEEYSGGCGWWLRTQGGRGAFAMCVNASGAMSLYGNSMNAAGNAVVPALCLDLSSDRWSVTEEGNPDPDDEFAPKYDEETDAAEWRTVYFGSYPQSEVTGERLTDAIENAPYDGLDAVVDGVRYRRVSSEDANNGDHFASSGYRYFKWEPIKWRVLEKDGDLLYLMADLGLDCKTYNDGSYGSDANAWNGSSLRSWLNDEFYNAAFGSAERRAIVQEGKENVHLLSASEAASQAYGFCRDGGMASKSRVLAPSDYAYVMGAYSLHDGEEAGRDCWWWLSSEGESPADVKRVYNDGGIDEASMTMAYGAVAPVLRVNMKQEEGPANPKYNEVTDTAEWSVVTFGSYPQEEAQATGDLINAKYNGNGDAVVKGETYRRIASGDTNDSSNFGQESEYRYFKWEPIRWKVLKKGKDTLFALADLALDCKSYNESGFSVTWEGSTLRQWLNGTFFQTAFTQEEQAAIVAQGADSGESVGSDALDQVRLLSVSEASDASYGFCGTSGRASKSRSVRPSEYAYVMGAAKAEGEGNCVWWLRASGSSGGLYASTVSALGAVGQEDFYNATTDAVVPALHIDRSSELWSAVEEEGGSFLEWPLSVGELSDLEVNVGEDVTFTAEVQGGAAFGNQIQWYLDGEAIEGANESSFTLEDVSLDSGVVHTYYCTVSSKAQSVTSNVASLTVHESGQEADTSLLEAAIADARKLDGSEYTAESWQALQEALSAALGLLEQAGATQEEVDAALRALEDAVAALVGQDPPIFDIFGPSNQTVKAGESATFQVRAEMRDSAAYPEGADLFRYQWYQASSEEGTQTKVTGANESSYTIENVTEEMDGTYYCCEVSCTATGTPWSRVSSRARLIVYTDSGEVDKSALSSVFNEAAELKEEDYSEESWSGFLAARKQAEETLKDSKATQEEVDAACDALQKAIDTLKGTKPSAPLSVSVPGDQTAKAGESVTFSVTASGGASSSYAYQWYRSASASGGGSRVNGAEASEYTVENVSAESDGTYFYCVVSDGVSEKESGRARLTVQWAPSVNELEDQTAKAGEDVTFAVFADGGNPSSYTYQWYVSMSPNGSGTGIAGETSSEYTLRGVGAENHGRYYYCVVSNGAFDVSSGRARLTVQKAPAVSAPKDQRVQVGENVTFQVEASEGIPASYTYQWCYSTSKEGDGIKISGAASDTYSINNVTESLNGRYYYCLVRNEAGEVKSGQALLTVYVLATEEEKAGLNGAVTQAGGYPKGDYTQESWDLLQQAILNAKNLLQREDVSKAEVEQAQQKLKEAVAGLKKKPASPKPVPTKLDAPTVKAQLASMSSVRLNWNPVSKATGYTVYCATKKNGKYSKVKTQTGTSFVVKKALNGKKAVKLARGKTYYFKVEAHNGTDISSMSAVVSKKMPPKKLATPKMPEIKVTGFSITIRWNKKIKNAQEMVIERKVGGKKFKKWKTVPIKKGKVKVFYGDDIDGSRHYFRMYARYKDGKITVRSKYSNTRWVK